MAVGTQYNKIFHSIVMSIFVFMVNAKYFRMFGVSTFLARLNHSSSFKSLSDSAISLKGFNSMTNTTTLLTAKNSFARWRCSYFFVAIPAFCYNSSIPIIIRLAFTRIRTILCSIPSSCNYFKFFIAIKTVSFFLCSLCFPFTRQ